MNAEVMINSIAPHWDGNQVWLLTAGGATFAAWPLVYAVSFSGFYIAMILTLAVLWIRPMAFDYRSKIENPQWRQTWDMGLFVSGFVPPVIFGVAFGNILQGVPFELNQYLMVSYHGSFFGLLNPFGLLCGFISLAMIVTQGAAYLQMKTEGELHTRARKVSRVAALSVALLFFIAGLCAHSMNGYMLKSALDHSAPSDPLGKEVIQVAWCSVCKLFPLSFIMDCSAIGLFYAVGCDRVYSPK